MARTNQTNDENKPQTTPEESIAEVSEIEELKGRIAFLLDAVNGFQEENKAKDEIIAEMKAAIEANGRKSMKALPTDVVEREKSMREKVFITVTKNPLDPGSKDVPYLDPITGQMCQIQRGVETEVSRAVYEILMNSMKGDEYTTIIVEEKVKEYEEATKKENLGA